MLQTQKGKLCVDRRKKLIEKKIKISRWHREINDGLDVINKE